MRHITGLIGREELIEKITREARKGRHLLLTGPAGVGKSTLLEAVIDRLIVRRDLIVLHVNEHQAKGQFLEIARGLLESGLLKPSALELDANLDALNPAAPRTHRQRRPDQPTPPRRGQRSHDSAPRDHRGCSGYV